MYTNSNDYLYILGVSAYFKLLINTILVVNCCISLNKASSSRYNQVQNVNMSYNLVKYNYNL